MIAEINQFRLNQGHDRAHDQAQDEGRDQPFRGNSRLCRGSGRLSRNNLPTCFTRRTHTKRQHHENTIHHRMR